MRIFISHCSEERWVVEQIVGHLENRGAKAICYENDIQTGAHIADSVWDEIGRCNDMLVLLTPAAVHSRWVAMEVGAALAQKKNVRLFRMWLTPDQIPSEISAGRSTTHLNDIGKYFEDVRRVIGGGDFIDEKVSVVKTLEVSDAPADELARSDLAQVKYPERSLDEVANMLRLVLERFSSLQVRKTDDEPDKE